MRCCSHPTLWCSPCPPSRKCKWLVEGLVPSSACCGSAAAAGASWPQMMCFRKGPHWCSPSRTGFIRTMQINVLIYSLFFLNPFYWLSHLRETDKLFKLWKFSANCLREKLCKQNLFSLLLFSSKRCVVLCDGQPGWHLGTVQHLFIIHSEVAAVQQLFLHITPLSSPFSSVCLKAELMSSEEEDLKVCLHSRNMVTVLFQMGDLYINICFWKTALKSLFVFHTKGLQDQTESIRGLWRSQTSVKIWSCVFCASLKFRNLMFLQNIYRCSISLLTKGERVRVCVLKKCLYERKLYKEGPASLTDLIMLLFSTTAANYLLYT